MQPRLSPKRNVALTLVEVLVVIAILALFFVMFDFGPPHNAKRKAQLIVCINNLKQIDLAYKLWSGDSTANFPMQVSVTNGGTKEFIETGIAYVNFQAMSNELSNPKILVCPTDGLRMYATNFTTDFNNRKINYFVGVDATDEQPNMFISGDDNLAESGIPAKSGLW